MVQGMYRGMMYKLQLKATPQVVRLNVDLARRQGPKLS